MHGSRSRYVGVHPSDWSPAEAYPGRGPHQPPGYYQQLPYQEPSSGYFGSGGGAPYHHVSTNAALQAFVDACSNIGLGSVPVGPPGGAPISPQPVEQIPPRNFSSFHAPSDTRRPPLDARGGWSTNDNPFLSRDRESQPSRQFHPREHPDSLRRDYVDRHNLPAPADARSSLFQRDENPSSWDNIPPLFGRGSETRDGQNRPEYHRSFSGGSAVEREYSGDRERGGRAYDNYASSHHRSRPRSPKAEIPVKERLGPAQGRPAHHHRGTQREGRVSDVEIIEHRSQSRSLHSPPPVHHHHPPEHRPRLEEDYNHPYSVSDRLGLPPPPPAQQPVPLFKLNAPLAERLGGSPDAMAHSVQARLGPPRITEPFDRNQGLVPFNTVPPPLLARSETLSPLPDLRQELENYNPMSRSTLPISESGFPRSQSPHAQHLSSSSGGAVPLFRRSPSPNRRLSLPIRGRGSTSPGGLSPVRAPGRQSLSPTSMHRSSSPLQPRSRPPTPPKRLSSPHRRSVSPARHPPSRPLSPTKDRASPKRHASSGRAQSPTSKSKSPRRGEKMAEEHSSRSRRSSRVISPPRSPSRTKKHSSSPSRHSRTSPPPSRHSRRSSGRIRSPTSDLDSKKRASSPRHKSRRSRSPSPTKRRSSSGGSDVRSKSPSSSRKRPSSSQPKSPPAKVKSSTSLQSSSRSPTASKSKLSAIAHQLTRASSKSVGEKSTSSSSGKKVSLEKPHNLPQRVINQDPVHPLLPSTNERPRRRSSSSAGTHGEDPSPKRVIKIEDKSVSTADSTTSRAHPLQHKQSSSTAPLESIGVAKSSLTSAPVPSSSLSQPPAPVLISNSNSPGPPRGGKSRDLSHDHHQEAGEFKFNVGDGNPTRESTDTASSSCSSPAPSIPSLMNLNFSDRHIPRDKSLFTASVGIGIPIAPGSRSQSASPSIAGSFVMDLETSPSKLSDIVSLPLSQPPEDTPFPLPLTQPEKNALPFSNLFEMDTPQPTVGVSESYLSGGQKSSPCTKKIVIRSSESSDTHQDVDMESENEGGLVIDESFVSQEENEHSPEKVIAKAGREKTSSLAESVSSSTTDLNDIKPPSSPDCEIISVSTIDSISSLSGQHRTVSSSDAEHRATPESSCSSEISKTSITRNIFAETFARRRSNPPASQRARKLATSVISTKLVELLVEGEEMEQDLLRRFFKAVVLVTERLKWKHKNKSATPIFLSYYKKMFQGFVTATISHRENIPTDLFKDELKALQKECGPYVSKWREQLKRFILLANTLPKDKKDLDDFVKNKNLLNEKVSASNASRSVNTPSSDGDRPTDPRKTKPLPPTPLTSSLKSSNLPATVRHTTGDSDPSKARPRPHAPPTSTNQHKAHSSCYSDRPTDPRKAKPLPSAPPTLSTGPSAFTPVVSTSSPSKISPSSKSSDSVTKIALSSIKPVMTDTGEHSASSYLFKPLTTVSEPDQTLFAADRCADYSLEPELDRAPSGLGSSVPSCDSDSELIIIDLVCGDMHDSCLPKTTGRFAEEERSLAGEKLSMNVFLSSSRKRSETTPPGNNQPGPPEVNMSAISDKILPVDSGVKESPDSKRSSSKLDVVSKPKASSVDLTTFESCAETEDGEIVSSSPSPAPTPEKRIVSTSPVLPMAYRDPSKWGRLGSREIELSRHRHRHLSQRSSRSRSSSPANQRRGSPPERFYRRRSRYRSRSRSWSRDRVSASRRWRSRSHDRRRGSLSRDRRSRSHDRPSRDRRRRSRSRSRSRGKSRSPIRRLRSQKSRVTAKTAKRRASRSDRECKEKDLTDSEDELEILKREALASMKQTLSGQSQSGESTSQSVKSNTQEELLRKVLEIDDSNEGGEIDMDLCSASSGDEEEGERKGMNIVRDRESGKMEGGGYRDAGSGGSVVGGEGDSIIDNSSRVDVIASDDLVDAATVQSNVSPREQFNTVVLSKEDVPAGSDQAERQDQPLPSSTLESQADKTEVKKLTRNSVPTVQVPVGRSKSAPSGASSEMHALDSSTMRESLPVPMTDQQSVAKSKSPSQSSLATNSQSSTIQPSTAKTSQVSVAKTSQPLAVTTTSKTSATPGQLSTITTTQPTAAKTSAGKTNRVPATKASQASLVTSSQQMVATKASQPLAATKSTQVKTSQTLPVKTTQPSSIKTSQTTQPSGKASQPSSPKASQAVLVKTSQASTVKTTPSSSSLASVVKTSQPSIVPSIATAVSKVGIDPAIKSLKKSLSCSSSRSGSKATSPCLSPTHTPSPSGSIDSQGVGGVVGGASSSDRVRHRSGSCVKVLPSNKATWDIQRFLIVSSGGVDSETESGSGSESDEEGTSPTGSPELSEISKMLLRAKAAAEETAQIEGQKKVQEAASEPLKLPSPPASLTTAQKKEYLELQRKLALHAKKKALGAAVKISSQGHGKGKTQQLASKLKGGQNTKDKLISKGGKRSPLKKPVSAQVAAIKGKVRSNSEPSVMPMAEQRRKVEGGAKEGRARNNTGPQQVKGGGEQVKDQKVGELSKGDDVTQPQIDQEEVGVSAEIRQRICGMEGAIQQHKSVVEKQQGELTTITHQLTDTVSEIEELELKMENLRKALKATEIAHKEAEQRRCELQDKVRDTKETITSTNSSIQQLERDISTERERLKKPPQLPSTDADTTPPTYENISDSEPTASESLPTTSGDKIADLAPKFTQTPATYTTIIRPEYEMISDAESMKSSTSSQASLRPLTIVTEPMSDSDEVQQPPSSVSRQASLKPPSIVTEPISDSEDQSTSVSRPSSLKPPAHTIITEPISDSEEPQQSSTSIHRQISSLRPPAIIVEPISDTEELQPTSSVSGHPSPISMENRIDLVRLEHDYCSFESNPPHCENTPAEASTTSGHVPPLVKPQDSSPSVSDVEMTSSYTATVSDEDITSTHTTTSSQALEDSECIVEKVVAEVPQVLIYDMAQESASDVTPSALQTVSLMPKKTFKKRKEPPPKRDKPVGRNRRSRKRRASAQTKATPPKRRRPKNIQFERQASLPASMEIQSPLESALSRAINTALCPALSVIVSPDSYSSLTQSFCMPEVAHNYSAHSNSANTPSTSQSTLHSLQNGFSSENRVPEILTDLVTSLNTETMTSSARSTNTQQQDSLNSSSNSRVTGILTNLVTSLNTETMMNAGIASPPLTPSEGQGVSSDGRVSGIVNNLVTYLTSETIYNAGSTVTTPTSVSGTIFANSASNRNAVSAIQRRQQEGMDVEISIQQHSMEVEICASPLTLPTDSDNMTTMTSSCEASEEYESEEDIGRRERIDADSLFHPGSNALFTLGEDEPPLFILPRLSCAGDFPLEIDPAAVSSVALDIARQGIIHAPPNNDLSSEVTESELTTGELSELSELSDGGIVAGERVQSMASIAESQSVVVGEGNEDQRDTTPSLEELNSATVNEPTPTPTTQQTSSIRQGSSTQQTSSSGKTLSKEGSEKTKGKHLQKESKGKRSSSVPPRSQAKSAANVQRSSKTSSITGTPATAATKATGSKVMKGEGVSVGGAQQSKEKGSSKLQLQLQVHMARLEELKGHLASKSTPQTTVTTTNATSTLNTNTTTSSSSNCQPTTATSKSTAAKSATSSKATTVGTKSITAKPTEKPATSSNSQQATTSKKSATGKSVASKSASSTTKKPTATKKQAASSSSQPTTTSKSTTSKSPAPKPAGKQGVASTSKESKTTDSQQITCARTMGYVRKTTTSRGKGKGSAKSSTSTAKVATTTSSAATKGNRLTVEAAMSEIGKIVKARKAKSSTTASSGDLQTMSDKLDRLWQSNQQSLLDTEPRPLPVVPSSSSFVPSHRLAMALPRSAISEKLIAGVEKLDKPKKQTTSSLYHSGGAPLTHKRTTYHPYSSPLLVFQSYRLNPLYRTNEKLPLRSLSHSNKIDPNRIMCRFELGGICNDPSCAGQHFKDISLNKEELIQDLVCYAPQLAGCSVSERDSESLAEQPAVAETKDEIASYASQMVERYSSKVSDEDLFKLTVHDINKERAKLRTDPRAKASYISFDDREWLTNKEDDLSSLPIKHPLSLLASESVGELAQREEGRVVAMEEGESEMEWSSISRELMPLGRQEELPSSQKCRYFSLAEEPSTSLSSDGPTAPGVDNGEPVQPATTAAPSPPSVREILQSLSSARARGEGSETIAKILKEAIQTHKTSEDLWIEYLRVQCGESSATPTKQESGTTSSAARQKDKGQLFLRAMAATNSYSVGLECIKLAEGYDMKLKCIREVVKLVMKLCPKPHPLSSHQCLELIVNMCVLDQLRGRPINDIITAVKALPYYDDTLSTLTGGDKQLLSLVYLHMTYTGTVPLCLLTTPTSGPTHPARLASKEPFLIEWSRLKNLSPQDSDKLRRLFEECLVLCSSKEKERESSSLTTSPEPSLVQSYLSLYQNLVLFESTHGDIDKALTLLQHLLSTCPSIPQLWALYARILDAAGHDWTDVLVSGTQKCPRNAELFHLAARLSLSHQSSDIATPNTSLDNAVQWLQQCVEGFYNVPSESSTDLELTIALYRKLLGQMIPYDLQLPELVGGVEPGNLGNQLAPLWLCYCLLVELILPSSSLPSSHSEFHHSSVEDAFESAIHSVHSPPTAIQSIWMEYLIYLRSKALEEDDLVNFDNFKAFSSAAHRCLIAVDYVRPLPNVDPDSTQSNGGVHEDYLFHDQVVDIFASVLPPTSNFLLSQLQKFHTQQPRNPVLVARLVQCALAQKPMREDVAQTALATCLANNPHCDFLWRMAGALEQRLGNMREARWIYHQAVRVSPTNADLWKDFLLLELKETSGSHQSSASSSSSLSLISTLLKKAKQSGINLWQAVKDHSSLSQ